MYKLAGWLRANKKSQRWLADQVGVTQAMISYILSGDRAAPFWLANDIAQVTGLKPVEVGRIFISKGGRKDDGEKADAGAQGGGFRNPNS